MQNLGTTTLEAATQERYPAAGFAQVHPHPVASSASEPVPIWFAVLMATSCRARSNGKHHAVRWKNISGRATYTNSGSEDEHIEPLGISLPGGQTLAVSWVPGETAYTLEVYD